MDFVDITSLFGFSSPTPSSPFPRGKGEGKFPRGKEKGIEKDLVQANKVLNFLFSSPLSERREDK